MYTIKELSDLSGIKYTTLCERLKRGYTAEEAISDNARVPSTIAMFNDASDYTDWNGLPCEDVYKIYWKWCDRNEFKAESNIHFTRCIKQLHPNLRVVPTRLKVFGDVVYKRVIRIDAYK